MASWTATLTQPEIMRKFLDREINLWVETYEDLLELVELCKPHCVSFRFPFDYLRETFGIGRVVSIACHQQLQHTLIHANKEEHYSSLPVYTFVGEAERFNC